MTDEFSSLYGIESDSTQSQNESQKSSLSDSQNRIGTSSRKRKALPTPMTVRKPPGTPLDVTPQAGPGQRLRTSYVEYTHGKFSTKIMIPKSDVEVARKEDSPSANVRVEVKKKNVSYDIEFETIETMGRNLADRFNRVARTIRKNQPSLETSDFWATGEENVTLIGRIVPETSGSTDEIASEKCKDATLYLENEKGVRVRLDTSNLRTKQGAGYSFFPGQVIAATGLNRLVAREREFAPHVTYIDASLPTVPNVLQKWGGSIDILTFAGPYGSYSREDRKGLIGIDEYFPHLKSRVGMFRPDVLVLMGPFVPTPSSTEDMMKCPVLLNHRFDELFSVVCQHIDELLRNHKSMKIILVPSLSDAFHESKVLPQAPIDISKYYSFRSKSLERIFSVSNPSIVDINGFRVGIFTEDIIRALSSSEDFCWRGDRMARLAGHLVRQQSFLPVFPPPSGMPMCVTNWEALAFDRFSPHMLLLHSDLQCFAHPVNDTTLCINPGTVGKGANGQCGSYAHCLIDMNEDGGSEEQTL